MPDQKKNKDPVLAVLTSVQEPILTDTGIFSSNRTKSEEDGSKKDQLLDRISVQKKFNEYLSEAIDEALTSLGAPVKNAVYFQLDNNFDIPKNEIPNQIEKFSCIIHKIFGLGASRLEIKFIKNLHSKIRVNIEFTEYEWPLSKWIINDISFVEYVCTARKNYCNYQEKTPRAKSRDE